MNKSLAILISIVFLDVLGIGIVIPILPFILFNTSILAGASIAVKNVMLGLLIASYPIMQFFSSPILGGLSDKFGRKPVLIFSIFGTFIGYAIFTAGILLENLPLLFLSRMFDGFTGGNISVVRSAIADISKKESKVKNFGLIGMAFGFGFIIGPFVGGKLSDPSILSWFNYATPFMFAAVLSLINLFFIVKAFEETLTERGNPKIDPLMGFRNIFRAFQLINLRWVFTSLFLLIFGWSLFTQFFQVYLYEKFTFTTSQIGDFFAYIGVWIIFTQGVVIRPVSRWLKPRGVLLRFMPISAIGLILLIIQKNPLYIYLIMPIISISSGLMNPNFSALISNLADKKSQGEIMGIQQSLMSLAQAVPPAFAGILMSVNSVLPTITASFFFIMAWIALSRVRNNEKFQEA